MSLPAKLAAFGDPRITSTSSSNSSPTKRKAIISAIAAYRPALLIVPGDLVYTGSSSYDWSRWDQETVKLRDAHVTVYPVLGNHDLTNTVSTALSRYFQRFPYLHQSRYYTVHAGNVMLIGLDSSQDAAGSKQMLWLHYQLSHLPKTVDFVIFQLHHPIRTQSTTASGGHPARATELALGRFIEDHQANTRQRFIVFSGHVHNYERYVTRGVVYVVTGGGGATPIKVPRDSNDYYRDSGATYEYCQLRVDHGRLDFAMMKLTYPNGVATWTKRDSFMLTVPTAAQLESPAKVVSGGQN